MNKKLITATYIGDFTILLVYEGNELRLLDYKTELKGDLGDFEDLKKEEVFKRFHILQGWDTIEWENGYDICPDVLYESSKPAIVKAVI